MDFRLSEEQAQFRDAVRRFAERHLAAGARERAHAAGYPWDVAKLMAGQGLLGIPIAEADAGQLLLYIAPRPTPTPVSRPRRRPRSPMPSAIRPGSRWRTKRCR